MKKIITGITLHIIVIADMFYAMTDLNLYPFYDIFLFLMWWQISFYKKKKSLEDICHLSLIIHNKGTEDFL